MEHLRLLRPHQWIKNVFIFFPLFVAGTTFINVNWVGLCLCFAAFCLASSCIYVINDIFDAERDKLHPIKKLRPIASGAVTEKEGWAMATGLGLAAAALANVASFGTLPFVIAYLGLNLCYSFWTKHIPLLDCSSIALGFCLRFMAGGVGFSLPINPYLLASCYFGSLAMALIKRRIELSGSAAPLVASRPSLNGLNLPVLDLLVGIFAATGIMLYAQWTLIAAKPLAVFTLPFLSILFSRIIWLAYLNKKGEDFSKTIISDIFALIATALFIGSLGASLYV